METIENQAAQTLKTTNNPVIELVEEQTEKLRLVVCPLNHDVMLGKTWCKKYDTSIYLKLKT